MNLNEVYKLKVQNYTMTNYYNSLHKIIGTSHQKSNNIYNLGPLCQFLFTLLIFLWQY